MENSGIIENLSTADLSTNTTDDYLDPCFYQEPVYVRERFWMVAVFGTIISIVNIIENLFLSFMLFKRKSYRSSHMLYLALLAFFDVWMAVAYIPLMSLNLFVDYYKSVVLLRAWFMYMLPMITISHIAMTASSFLMVAASLERYFVTIHPTKTRWLQKNRTAIAGFSILMGVASKFSQLFEMEINYQPECYGTMKEYQLSLSNLAQTEIYGYWRVLIRTIVTILIPFFLLAFMNIRIVYFLSKNEFKFLQSAKLSDAKRKSAVRNATRTLVFCVFTYLLSNVLNVIIILWEYIDYEMIAVQFITFYMFAVDVVSLSTIFSGALRLPIYVACQPDLRKDIFAMMKECVLITGYKCYKESPIKNAVDDQNDHDLDEEEEDVDEKESPKCPLILSLGTVLMVESDQNPQSCKVIRPSDSNGSNSNKIFDTFEKLQSV